VTEYVIVETVNFFSKPINRPKVHAMVSRLRDKAKFEIVPATFELFEAGNYNPANPLGDDAVTVFSTANVDPFNFTM
jgi:hypothetical protein